MDERVGPYRNTLSHVGPSTYKRVRGGDYRVLGARQAGTLQVFQTLLHAPKARRAAKARTIPEDLGKPFGQNLRWEEIFHRRGGAHAGSMCRCSPHSNRVCLCSAKISTICIARRLNRMSDSSVGHQKRALRTSYSGSVFGPTAGGAFCKETARSLVRRDIL